MRSGEHGTGRRRPRPTRTFVSLTGPAGNLGDALIRRGTLDWARGTSDELVAYVGGAPDVWLRQLGVPTGTRVLRSKRSVARWLWMLATAPGRPVLVFEAGEVPLDRGNGVRELVFLAETLLVRLKRGVVVRPPRAVRAPTQPSLWLHSTAARASQFALWRDDTSRATTGGSQLAPDIGFAAGQRAGLPDGERDELIVSLRGKRPLPAVEWADALTDFAAANGLRIRTVVQVREDEERARELAQMLGGEFDPWGERDAVAQEALVRERYDHARLVISDRLHVLILAALSGAVPAEVVADPTRKITDSFATIGLAGVSADAASLSPDEITAFLTKQLTRADEVRAAVATAYARLAETEADIRTAIEAARA
ncbi:polysaccharide pyruvyl transferase family protein [Microbacterium sp. NEAU-LLC]|uniref:Polysaccharide pyruvyl transferase family protein n=1 Tax=Microbacterium helvum TaxID=2773713 RepID=A0ABR8NY05_9MICO|nr:polysaccharide pyruvyl transferase family protein [Microbacterium helvum]MBD3943931.1 polysaccharide pyruvyl transferase family protein [Microbacterium helvum]